jgi:hypothetical protein
VSAGANTKLSYAVQQNVLQYIDVFYKNHRLDFYLRYKKPNQYEAEAAKSYIA